MIQTYQIDLDHAAIFDRCMSIVTAHSLVLSPTNETLTQKVLLGGYENYDQYNIGPHTWPELQDLIAVLNSKIDGSWFNVMIKDSYIKPHVHPKPHKYVCVYYPHSLPEHPPFEYLDPTTSTWQTKQCNTGDYLIFPKMLLHRVGVQSSSMPRCSISINI